MNVEYTNPILDADWSDPDAIRVGDEYFMTASTFNRVPGLPILCSSDLVHWRLVGHALSRLVPEGHYDLPRLGSGVWAPALRFHDGRYFIFYSDPDHGIFMIHASDPSGPWSEPHLTYPGRGLIDPCPLWDDDGRAYLAHAWAMSRAGISNLLTMHEMTPDGCELLGPGRVVIDGHSLPGFSVLEGPKLHKRAGWYWIFAPAGGVPTGWQSVFRSRSIWGPYEERTTLIQGNSAVNGPHQGAWVDAADGTDWFLHFQDRGPFGRVVHLQPMSWSEDGWPQMGTNWDGQQGTTPGIPVTQHTGPTTTTSADSDSHLDTNDDWSDGPGGQWYWQANPQPGWFRTPGDGTLALAAIAGDPANLCELPHILAQRIPAHPSRTTVTLNLENPVPGARAGLTVLGRHYCWLGLECTPDGHVAVTAATGGETRAELPLSTPTPVNSNPGIEIEARVNTTAQVSLAWRVPNGAWTEITERFQAEPGHWTGAHIGLFATSPTGTPTNNLPVARFGTFHLQPDP